MSAVVVNFNGGSRVLQVIECLERQTAPLEEVIVVDNQSTDGSVALIRRRFPRVRIIEMGENRGPAAARNAGLQAVSTPLVLFNDADVYLSVDAVHRLREACRRHRVTLVCPRVLFCPEGQIIQCDGAAAHWVGTLLLRHGGRPQEDTEANGAFVGGAISACLLVDRRDALAAGGFDETYFFHFEDLDFGLRLRLLGYDLFCEPSAVAYHDRGEGTPGIAFRGRGAYPARRAYLTMRGRLRCMLIHYRLRSLLALAPALALYEAASLSAALWHGWSVEWLRAWWWQIANAKDLWKRRCQAQRLRVRSDRELLSDGPLPLAPGFIRSPLAARAANALSAVLHAYWRIARRWIG